MKYQHIIFDLDGTLTDSGPGIRNAVRHALKKYGIEENDTEKLNRFIGPPLYDSFMRFYGISEKEAAKGENYFREYYRDTGIFENSVYDGIINCLETLNESGVKLYIATSKPDFMAERVLCHFDLKKYFTDVCGADIENGRCSKKDVLALLLNNNPEINCENAVMVGDREHDIFGAENFGIKGIGVLWGYGSEKELKDAGAAFISETPEKLYKYILG
ncbi:MAG: HAD family hydrolase [Ruminococcaceae bacterium]|nr:HAD family hydrolase [Oscillospiraceae bacterium]